MPTYDFAKRPRKLHKITEIWSGGMHIQDALRTGSADVYRKNLAAPLHEPKLYRVLGEFWAKYRVDAPS